MFVDEVRQGTLVVDGRGEDEEKEAEEKEKEKEATNIKSNNPHLAGVENHHDISKQLVDTTFV